MQTYGNKVKHRFTKTTVIGSHVFFKGSTEVGEQLLERHKREVAEKARKAREAEAQEGMTASELLDQTDNQGAAGTPEGTFIPPALREDGPTPEAWVKAGYDMANYPPAGYAAKPYENEAGFAALLEKVATERASVE